MGITSLDITNSSFTYRAKIINIVDFDSKQLSIIKTKKIKYMFIMTMIHFFCLLII